MVMVFLLLVLYVATQMPQVQEAVPLIKTFNSDLARFLGSKGPSSDASGQIGLANPGRSLKDLSEPGTLPTMKDCGPPPENPWTSKGMVSPVDAERYELALRIWEYCKKERHEGGDSLPTFSPSGQEKPGDGLDSYPDETSTPAEETPPQ
jgi:hypothetical protein